MLRFQSLSKKRTNTRHPERGQAILETAIFSTFLLVVLLGMIDIGQYTNNAIQVNNAARAGAQYASQTYGTAFNQSAIATAVTNDAAKVSPAPTVTSSPYCVCTGTDTCTLGSSSAQCTQTNDRQIDLVSITAIATSKLLFNFPALGLPANVKVSGTAIMQIVNPSSTAAPS